MSDKATLEISRKNIVNDENGNPTGFLMLAFDGTGVILLSFNRDNAVPTYMGSFTGKTKFFYDDGSVYDGDFKDGQMHGIGKMTFPNGITYEGEWSNGKENGKGTVSWPDGRKFEGEFVGGKINKKVEGKITSVFGIIDTGFFDESKLKASFNAAEKKDDDGLGGSNSRMKRQKSKRRRQSKRD